MRAGKNIVCAKCGYEGEYINGVGYFNAIYHCNKCGKEKIVELNDGDAIRINPRKNSGLCTCSGTFSMNNKYIICPKCHNKMPNDGLEEMLWD